MVIFHTGILIYKVALITAGSDNSFVCDAHAAQISVFILRILNADFPLTAIGFISKDVCVSAKVNNCTLDAIAFHHIHNSSGRITLGNSAQIDLHAFRETDACLSVFFA